MQTQLILSKRLGFGDPDALDADLALSDEVGRIINGLLNTEHQRQPRKPE